MATPAICASITTRMTSPAPAMPTVQAIVMVSSRVV